MSTVVYLLSELIISRGRAFGAWLLGCRAWDILKAHGLGFRVRAWPVQYLIWASTILGPRTFRLQVAQSHVEF